MVDLAERFFLRIMTDWDSSADDRFAEKLVNGGITMTFSKTPVWQRGSASSSCSK